MTDKTEPEVTAADERIAREVMADWLGLSVDECGANSRGALLIQEGIRRHRLATRAPDPTPVALSDEEAFRQLHLLYNYIDDDSIQFTRWQMVGAMSHGMRLAHPPAVPADGLVEALEAIIDRAPERDRKWFGMTAKDIATQALAAYRGEA